MTTLQSTDKSVVATLVLLNGGTSAIKKVMGRTARYDFQYAPGAGPDGRVAHIREYASLDAFHKEQADLALSPMRLSLLVRLQEVNPAKAAQTAVRGLVRHLMSPQAKLAVIEGMMEELGAERERVRANAECRLPNGEGGAVRNGGTDAGAEIVDGRSEMEDGRARTRRESRAMELRRCGEEFVRFLLKEEYAIDGVRTLNNFEGMMDAVLEFEEGRGDFGEEISVGAGGNDSAAELEGSAPSLLSSTRVTRSLDTVMSAPGACLAKGSDGALPSRCETVSPAEDMTLPRGMIGPHKNEAHSAEALAVMPIDELKALAMRLGCRTGNRRTMARVILGRQKEAQARPAPSPAEAPGEKHER